MSLTFSCTCQPNKNEHHPQRVKHRIKFVIEGDRQSLINPKTYNFSTKLILKYKKKINA